MSSNHGRLRKDDLHRGCGTAACSRPGVWLLPAELGSAMQAADELRQYMTELVLQKGDLLFSQVTQTILPSHTWLCWFTAYGPGMLWCALCLQLTREASLLLTPLLQASLGSPVSAMQRSRGLTQLACCCVASAVAVTAPHHTAKEEGATS